MSPLAIQLLVQLQDKETIITSLTDENDHMSSALNAAESRLSELYAEQNRMEEEMSARIEVAEKLRQQVRELEKEKRDLTRRYNEQVCGSGCGLRFSRLMQRVHRLPPSRPSAKHFTITKRISSLVYSLSCRHGEINHHLRRHRLH